METNGTPEGAWSPEDPYAVFLRFESLIASAEAREAFEDAYIGRFASDQALGEHLLFEMGAETQLEEFRQQMVAGMRHYLTLDAEAFVHDLDCNGELYKHDLELGGFLAYWAR